ncbi:helix-turn-helix transcriptional regulator [Lactococcus protaetiae]|uniref:YafY family transcriptional regulator n=1 Tax=Lactococcus protaetiae TaxID=2592653 RepID=A0A514Z5W9_9LACT|nr:YafY family protein [Lactococcus protaetiae]QDK70005.1 YafY family transcriptional regulator [Lactococcus protaetiae]
MKISRLIEILLTLLSRETVSATEFAMRFEVSKKTIYRDVESLNLAGIPVYLKQGRYGGLTLENSYKLDKHLLSTNDLQNILLALSSVHQQISNDKITATLEKISSMIVQENQQIFFDWQGNMTAHDELRDLTQCLADAIQNYQRVGFSYIDAAGNESQREVEPTNIFFKVDHWYLHAYDDSRKAFRNFKLSRMMNVKVLKLHFEAREVPKVDIVKDDFLQATPLFKVKIVFDKSLREKVVDWLGQKEIIRKDNQNFEITITLPLKETSFRQILSLGNKAKIIADSPFEKAFRDYLSALVEHYPTSL